MVLAGCICAAVSGMSEMMAPSAIAVRISCTGRMPFDGAASLAAIALSAVMTRSSAFQLRRLALQPPTGFQHTVAQEPQNAIHKQEPDEAGHDRAVANPDQPIAEPVDGIEKRIQGGHGIERRRQPVH